MAARKTFVPTTDFDQATPVPEVGACVSQLSANEPFPNVSVGFSKMPATIRKNVDAVADHKRTMLRNKLDLTCNFVNQNLVISV
ncbi:hypothetical protein GCM10027454_09600 [Algoriphagus aestuariicola]